MLNNNISNGSKRNYLIILENLTIVYAPEFVTVERKYIDNPQLVQSPLALPKSGLWDSSFLPKFSSWGGYSFGSEM